MLDILVGLQWGDEGKGKIVDVLTENYDIIARFQGGPNAGHTLKVGDVQVVLHLIPSGILRANTINVIGNGVVFDPVIFRKELEEIKEFAPDAAERILISRRAHLILPTHRLLDAGLEKAKGKNKIGSTLRGIGPTYADKISRSGIRLGEIFSKDFDEILTSKLDEHLKYLGFLDYVDFNLADYLEPWLDAVEMLRDFKIVNTEYFINKALDKQTKVLAEGAQGTLLDIDFGTYPFVTSSNTIASNACNGLGVPANKVGEIYGIFKAYTTRVGQGPFPTELFDQTGQKLRDAGNEYGATTGRPRRTGWLDLVALRYAVMLNGVTQLIMTKADVLEDFEAVKVATKYDLNGQVVDEFPLDLTEVKPVYDSLPGWQTRLEATDYEQLPTEFKNYIDYIEKYIGKHISAISIGARRREILWRN